MNRWRFNIVVKHKNSADGNVSVYIYNKDDDKEMLIKDFGMELIMTPSLFFAERLSDVLGCMFERYEERKIWKKVD